MSKLERGVCGGILIGAVVVMGGTPVLLNAGEISNIHVKESVEAFEMYCFRTAAKYVQMEKLAIASKLLKAPEELSPFVLGGGSTEGQAYVIRNDPKEGKSLVLAISKPDACGIYVGGVSFSQVERVLKENYRLASLYRGDVGLQVTEMFVPGGKNGDKEEAKRLGLISVSYAKPGFGEEGFSISFMPPETVGIAFK